MNAPSLNTIVIADNDDWVGHLPTDEIDLLIALGDLYDVTLEKAIDFYAPEHVIAVRGNHDVITEFPRPTRDLHLDVIDISGLLFGGFGGSWRYKRRGHHLYEQDEVIESLKDFLAVDVFIAHNSPRGIHERDDHVHQGFDAFIDYIDRVQPRYFFHGHQHCQSVSFRGRTQIIGVYGERAVLLTPNGKIQAT